VFATAEALSPDREDFDEMKIDPNLRQRLEEDASDANNVVRLLQAILNSHALASHLNFLADEDALELPNRMSAFDMVFASQNRMELFLCDAIGRGPSKGAWIWRSGNRARIPARTSTRTHTRLTERI